MKLELKRRASALGCTLGELYVDGVFECYTLEDVVRVGPKVYGTTAIPAGRYDIEMYQSPRFKQLLPMLLNVPGYSYVLIHAGNTAKDTEGCILVGQNRDSSTIISGSRAALKALLAKLTLPAEIVITQEVQFATPSPTLSR